MMFGQIYINGLLWWGTFDIEILSNINDGYQTSGILFSD